MSAAAAAMQNPSESRKRAFGSAKRNLLNLLLSETLSSSSKAEQSSRVELS